jgi:hypothetical protein
MASIRSTSSEAFRHTRGPPFYQHGAASNQRPSRPAPRSRDGPICAVWRRENVRFLDGGAVVSNRAAYLTMERRSGCIDRRQHLSVYRCWTEQPIRFVRRPRATRENFFSEGIFLPKTCCTNTANLYNYEQVEWEMDRVSLGDTSLRIVQLKRELNRGVPESYLGG